MKNQWISIWVNDLLGNYDDEIVDQHYFNLDHQFAILYQLSLPLWWANISVFCAPPEAPKPTRRRIARNRNVSILITDHTDRNLLIKLL